ncbi:aceric acid hydrolase [Parapedobacter tibetensis]|uniref:aceric acid hydrolase n=1 Tax=Parapedobacter tibetensis TaxID=2972951 RepID=UPI00214D52F9|nr:glycoside hydrolase family 127 protein [Parapedobacter tibetensis]
MERYVKRIALVVYLIIASHLLFAQQRALVNTSGSPYAKLHAADMGAVKWTEGFWAERFDICTHNMVPTLWNIYTDHEISHAFRNFEIAAGLYEGVHRGPSFHDGDFYKTMEAVCGVYAITQDKKLERWLEEVIPVIAQSQREDGYIYTKATIDQRNTGAGVAFEDRLSFEAYNIGHLMTAACIHHRVTSQTNLLDIAKKAADYLYGFYKKASPTLARNAICPSHYMGVVEMYRTTNNPRYLELATHLVDIRGEIEDGTDDNQDRVPFRQQNKAVGHAVRATYLYAGVADLFAETGDTTLMNRLEHIWHDLISHKMYVTGGCGSLYDGVSPDGTSYNPDTVQKVHQAFGRDYQLPNFTAHNETCANIGNVLWNWRMLLLTGDAKYADVMELALYNSVLSGVSLDGGSFLYTNPLSYSDRLPFQQRWSKKRVPYISLSNCCPPNTVRTVAEVVNYLYSFSDSGIWFNLYGGNTLDTEIQGGEIKITQTTDYPWDGKVNIHVEKAPAETFSFFLRVPGWCASSMVLVNGEKQDIKSDGGNYMEISRLWKAGDRVELILDMPVTLLESNPLVEETRNQIAVKRGPMVYCLEAADIPAAIDLFDLAISVTADFRPVKAKIGESTVMLLSGNAVSIGKGKWDGLYRPVSVGPQSQIPVKLIPYYAWGNREFGNMSVWLPVVR